MRHRDAADFATMLRQYRLAAGLTQEGLAERAHLSSRAISDLERGVKRSPHRDTIELLMGALALSPREREAFRALARGLSLPRDPRLEPLTVVARASHAIIPPVGRDEELAQLEQIFALQGPPCLLFAGEPGIGKSRLLHEAANRAAEFGYQVFAGGSTQAHGQEPYTPVVEAIARYLHQQELVDLRVRLAGCAWLIRLLPELADGPIEALPTLNLAPSQERRLIFRAVVQLLHNAAGPAGVLLILDDLQWAGADGLDLIIELVRNADDIPLRVVGAYRDTELEKSPALSTMLGALGQARLITHHHLVPIADADAITLLDVALRARGEDVPPNERNRILQRAEGVPFYLLSLVDDPRSDTSDRAVPWTVRQSVRQRLQALPEPVQTVISAAAVMGREIRMPVLSAATNQPATVVLDALDAAQRAHLLLDVGAETYRFAHDLIREVLEADLSTARRASVHQSIAKAIEQTWQRTSPITELPVERLAYHYRECGDYPRAIAYLARAAARARQAAAHHEEVNFLSEALTLAGRCSQSCEIADLQVRRGVAYFDLGQWAEARQDLEAAATDLAQEQDERLARVFVDLAMVCHWLLDVANTRHYATAALRLAERLDRRDLVAEAMSALAFADSSDGALVSSLNQYRRAFAVSGARKNPRLVPAGEMSALINYWLGQHEQAIAVGQETLRLAREVGDTAYTARVLGNLGLALTGAGRYAEALATFAEARQFSRDHGLAQWLARATSMEGSLHFALFDYAAAEALAEEARELARSLKWPLGSVSAAIDLVLNLVRRGDAGARPEQFLREATEAAVAAAGAHGWLWQLRLVQARAELALARESWEEARGLADRAIALSHLRGRIKYETFAQTTRAAALRGLRRDEAALAVYDTALSLAQSTADPSLLLHVAAARLAFDRDETFIVEAQSAAARIASSLPDPELAARFQTAAPIAGLFSKP